MVMDPSVGVDEICHFFDNEEVQEGKDSGKLHACFQQSFDAWGNCVVGADAINSMEPRCDKEDF